MSRPIPFISNSIPGIGPTDAGCLPCSGVSGCAVSTLRRPNCGHYNQSQTVNSLSFQCTSRNIRYICRANSSNHRRSPHFPRQNKQGFSHGRNRQSEEGLGSENLQEPEMFSSKDGPGLTSSGYTKFQATATPGPREREIVELFRKVQAQLRERAAAKEERKVDESHKKSKPTETVDSLLKLLRKHSVQDGKRSVRSDNNRDFILDKQVQNGSFPVDRKANSLGSSSSIKHDKGENELPVSSRPKSNFQRRSPVRQVLPVQPDKEPVNSVPHTDSGRKGNQRNLELEIEPDAESDFESTFSDDDEFDDLSDTDDEIPDVHEDDNANLPGQTDHMDIDLSGMKLAELKTLAKSRGLKGFSKLKKHDLVELLSERSI